MSTVNFLKTETARQDAGHGTANTVMQYQLPFVTSVTDSQEAHDADWDSGTFISGTISSKVNDFANLEITGSAFFEMLPMFFNAGYRYEAAVDIGTGGAGVVQRDPDGGGLLTEFESEFDPDNAGPLPAIPAFQYAQEIEVTRPGDPSPYTFRHGAADTPIDVAGTTGKVAVQIRNAYCQSLTLNGGVNQKVVQLRSSWFGHGVDDNERQGYEFGVGGTPNPLTFLRALGNEFWTKDSALDGDRSALVLTDADKTNCHIIDWELAINYGTEPKWGADGAGPSYCGLTYSSPTVEFRPTIRTDSLTWQKIRGKFDDRTYQDMRFRITAARGPAAGLADFDLTGRWTNVPQPFDRQQNEVVMKPVFKVERYPPQANAHVFSWIINTLYQHN